MDFLDKKPGVLSGLTPRTIFVKMIRRVGTFGGENSATAATLQLRPKCNDALNDVVAKVDQHILTVNSCNTYEDFDRHANLSIKEKQKFWSEIGDLIERFDANRVKLLANPKNPPKTFKKIKSRVELPKRRQSSLPGYNRKVYY